MLSIIFDIIGLIFNEFIVLFCCGFDYNTYKTIALRAQIHNELAVISREKTHNDEESLNNTNSILNGL